MILALAEQMKLPGFGKNVHSDGHAPCYARRTSTCAWSPTWPSATDTTARTRCRRRTPQRSELFTASRRHLPKTVFDAARWKTVVGDDLWPHVVYVLNRGGRFQNFARAYKDGQLTNQYGKLVGFYFENLLTTKNSMTGKPYLHYADFVPGPRDCAGNLLDHDKQGFDLTLITYKSVTQTKSRTGGNYWLHAAYPENYVEINSQDAARLGLKSGDQVKVASASNA